MKYTNFEAMAHKVTLIQNSVRTCLVSHGKLPELEAAQLYHILKKHGGASWNPILQQFELPLRKTASIVKELAALYPPIAVREVLTEEIKRLFWHLNDHDSRERPQGKIELVPQRQWRRMIVLDPLMSRRYSFVLQHALDSDDDRDFVRGLLFCSNTMRSYWERQFAGRRKVSWREMSHQELNPEVLSSHREWPLKEDEITIVTYDKMRDIGNLITKRVLMKYSMVFCDDSELWLQPRDPVNDHDLSSKMRKIIEKGFPREKDLILMVSRLEVDIASLLSIANLLHPHSFATDPLFISKNQANDATWLKTRYRRDSLLQKELFFIFSSTVLVNMLLVVAHEEKKALYDVPDFTDSVVTIPLKENSQYNLKAIDKRFKKVDKRKVVTSLQTHRTIGTLLTTQSALEEENYLRQLREGLLRERMDHLRPWLEHLTSQLRQRVAIVVEGRQGLDMFSTFLRQTNIKYVVYRVKPDEYGKLPTSYTAFWQSEALVCLIVRDVLSRECRALQAEREKMLELAVQEEAELHLGVEPHGLHQMHRSDQLFKAQQPIDLPKLTTVRHVLYADTFWHDFSEERQLMVNNLFNATVNGVDQAKADEERRRDPEGMVKDWMKYVSQRKQQICRHFFIFSKSNEAEILRRYQLNLEDLTKQQVIPSPVDALDLFWKDILKQHEHLYQGRELVEEVYDMDEDFDKYEFELRKKEQEEEKKQRGPVYNTKIEGLVVEASLPAADNHKKYRRKEESQSQSQSQLFSQGDKPKLLDISWLEEDEIDISGDSGLEIRKYLLHPEGRQECLTKEGTSKNQPKTQRDIFSNRRIKREPTDLRETREEMAVELQPPILPFLAINKEHPYSRDYQQTVVEPSRPFVPSRQPKPVSQMDPSQSKSVSRDRRSRTLWGGPKAKTTKIIARKPMTLTVRLIPGVSSITFDPARQDLHQQVSL